MAKQGFDLGSSTAKGGFRNEDDVIQKFVSWEKDEDAQQWLIIMGYILHDIEYIQVIKIHGFKADVQVQIRIKLKQAIDVENIQIKLVSNTKGFNQIDKRWVDNYDKLWSIPEEIRYILKRFTGETKPDIDNPKDKRRMFVNEFKTEETTAFLQWLNENKILIISDILKGRGEFCSEWMLVIQKSASSSRWILKSINEVLNYFGNGDIAITPRGSVTIGKITMQRKGGDGGRPTANMLQFKINPAELFDI